MELELKITCTCHRAKIAICCQTPLVTPTAPKICTGKFFNMLNPNLPLLLLFAYSRNTSCDHTHSVKKQLPTKILHTSPTISKYCLWLKPTTIGSLMMSLKSWWLFNQLSSVAINTWGRSINTCSQKKGRGCMAYSVYLQHPAWLRLDRTFPHDCYLNWIQRLAL